jgi:hypothetical protein
VPVADLLRLRLLPWLLSQLASGTGSAPGLPMAACKVMSLCEEVARSQAWPGVGSQLCEVPSVWYHRRPYGAEGPHAQPVVDGEGDWPFSPLGSSTRGSSTSSSSCSSSDTPGCASAEAESAGVETASTRPAGGGPASGGHGATTVPMRVVDAVLRSCSVHLPEPAAHDQVVSLARAAVLDANAYSQFLAWLTACRGLASSIAVLERVVVTEGLGLPPPVSEALHPVLRVACALHDVVALDKVRGRWSVCVNI